MALNSVRVPNPWRKRVEGARRFELQTAGDLTYATRETRVRANEPIAFTVVNPDVVPHNWVLVRPGALRPVGEPFDLQQSDGKKYSWSNPDYFFGREPTAVKVPRGKK